MWCVQYQATSRRYPSTSTHPVYCLALGETSQTELGGPNAARQFRRDTAWRWNVTPRLGLGTITHHTILVEGIYIGSWCLLIAVTEDLQVLTYGLLTKERTRYRGGSIGYTNDAIRSVLRDHRGMSEAHMKREAEWFLILRKIPLHRIHEIITQKPTDETIETTKRPE